MDTSNKTAIGARLIGLGEDHGQARIDLAIRRVFDRPVMTKPLEWWTPRSVIGAKIGLAWRLRLFLRDQEAFADLEAHGTPTENFSH